MSPSLGNEVPPSKLDGSGSLIPEVAKVYTRFSALTTLAKERFNGELGGKLLLYGQFDAQGIAVALAANIAGAATLGVDADPERLRQGLRYGFCDLVVNHLDEALRILKNEVRKKQPVSVCLDGNLGEVLVEAVERGFQPELLAFAEVSSPIATLIQRGAILLDPKPEPQAQTDEVTWTAESASALWLPKVDLLAAQVLPGGDERSRWLKLAPRYLGRTMAERHYLQMTTMEVELFTKLVADAMASGTIGTRITLHRPKRQPHPLQRLSRPRLH